MPALYQLYMIVSLLMWWRLGRYLYHHHIATQQAQLDKDIAERDAAQLRADQACWTGTALHLVRDE